METGMDPLLQKHKDMSFINFHTLNCVCNKRNCICPPEMVHSQNTISMVQGFWSF